MPIPIRSGSGCEEFTQHLHNLNGILDDVPRTHHENEILKNWLNVGGGLSRKASVFKCRLKATF
jgi:hypothetical protein